MAAVQVAMAYKSGGVFAAVREIIKQHPIWTMLLSNSVTAWALLYYFSKDQVHILPAPPPPLCAYLTQHTLLPFFFVSLSRVASSAPSSAC